MQAVTPRWRYDQMAAFLLPPPPHPTHHFLAVVNAEPLMAVASSSSSLKNVCLPPPSPYLSNNETTQLSVSIHNGAALEPSWPVYKSRGASAAQQQLRDELEDFNMFSFSVSRLCESAGCGCFPAAKCCSIQIIWRCEGEMVCVCWCAFEDILIVVGGCDEPVSVFVSISLSFKFPCHPVSSKSKQQNHFSV